jgi:hypothetical protein
MTAAAPLGVVTFLFTDVEGPTRRWEADADAMRIAVAADDVVLRTAIEANGGWLFKHTGDGSCAAFARRKRRWMPKTSGWRATPITCLNRTRVIRMWCVTSCCWSRCPLSDSRSQHHHRV